MLSRGRKTKILLLIGLAIGFGSLPWILLQDSQTSTPPAPAEQVPAGEPRSAPLSLGARQSLTGIHLDPAPDAEPGPYVVSGRVLDALHAPIAGCRVLIEGRSAVAFGVGPGEGLTTTAEQRCDAQGRFQMHLLELGPWVLSLLHPDYPPTIIRSDLRLSRDRVTDLGDLQLHSQIGLIVIIEGIAGTPIGGARLSLQPVIQNPEFATRTQRALRRAAISDASGRALFYGIAPGAYRLRVEATGLATVERNHQQARLLQRPPLLRMQLLPGHVLRGRLTDAGGAPIAGAWVALTPQHGGTDARTQSTESGLFRLPGLQPGRHRLRVASAAHGSLQLDDIEIPHTEGQLELRFPPGLEIAGIIVRRSDRQPLVGANIRLFKEGFWPELRAGEVYAPKGRSDRHGEFRFSSLTQGRYRIEVLSKGLFPTTTSLLVSDSAMPVEVAMREAYVLTGRLLDQRGRALSGGLIEVMPSSYDGSEFAEFKLRVVSRLDPGVRTHSDPEGRFRIDAIAGGDYRLRLSARDKARQLTISFRSEPDQSFDLGDLILDDASRVHGQAFLARGDPAKEALVCLDPTSPSSPPALSHQTIADDSGHFRFDGIAAGSYSLFYYYPKEQIPGPSVAYRTRSLRRIEVRKGALERQDLVLR